MNELDLLKQFRSDVPDPPHAAWLRARAAIAAARLSDDGATSARRRQPLVAWRLPLAGRRPAMLSALGASAAGIVASIVLLTGSVSASSAVAFDKASGGTIIAKVTEPFAAQKELDAAFAARGYHITVQLIPASPSIVGTVIAMSSNGPKSNIEALQGGPCVTGGGGCPIGVRIPPTFAGEASIALGRPAKPGERYESQASAFAPGERLHCSGLLDDPVGKAIPVLAAEKLTVVWNVQERNSSGHSVAANLRTPPSSGYVWDAGMIEPGKVRVFIHSAPPSSDPRLASYEQRLNRGCAASATGRDPRR